MRTAQIGPDLRLVLSKHGVAWELCFLLTCKCIAFTTRLQFTIMDKSLGTIPIHTGPTPPLSLQTMLDAFIQNFFRVSTLCRVGGRRTARKF